MYLVLSTYTLLIINIVVLHYEDIYIGITELYFQCIQANREFCSIV
jgi:hypothetical protein